MEPMTGFEPARLIQPSSYKEAALTTELHRHIVLRKDDTMMMNVNMTYLVNTVDYEYIYHFIYFYFCRYLFAYHNSHILNEDYSKSYHQIQWFMAIQTIF